MLKPIIVTAAVLLSSALFAVGPAHSALAHSASAPVTSITVNGDGGGREYNGVGAVLGSSLSGIIIDRWFTYADQSKNWHGIWITFALYALAMAILFVPLFKHLHDPIAMRNLHPEPVVGP